MIALSRFEHSILDGILAGETFLEISARTGRSVYTVINGSQRVYKKKGAKNRVSLMALEIERLRACMVAEVPACAAIKLFHGEIIAGRRHSDCLSSIQSLGVERSGSSQGFMTTKGRFVARVAAQMLMKSADRKSVDPGGYRGTDLYSEDLY